MQASIQLPKAFSVRDEHEFYPIQHLMARLNPKLHVKQVATGRHVNGGETVFWGLIYLNGKPPEKSQEAAALREAGFDFDHNAPTDVSYAWSDHQ